jgi:hypothetical protein
MLKVDERTLNQTAEAMAKINPARTSRSHILATARANLGDMAGSYVSTCGWIAFTWYEPHTGDTHMRFAVEPYSLLRSITENKIEVSP